MHPADGSSSNPDPRKLLVNHAQFQWGNPTNESSSNAHTRGPHRGRLGFSLLAVVGTARGSRILRKCYVPGRPSPRIAMDAKDKNLRQALCPRPRMARAVDEKASTARLALDPNGERHPEKYPRGRPRHRWREAIRKAISSRDLAANGERRAKEGGYRV